MRKAGADSLDPVRWRPPARSVLVRLSVITTLLALAATVVWSGSSDCEPCPAAPAGTTRAPTASPDASQAPVSDAQAPASPTRPTVPAGSVGVPVRLAEPSGLALVRPGDRVDLLRLEDQGGTTQVARAALVVTVTGADDPVAGGLLVAVTPDEARAAVAGAGRGFAILLRPD